jgi:primase-polymerase (primpol)-like protein
MPLDPRTGGPADVTNRETWGSFDEALRAAPKLGGIGVVFTEADPFAGIDLDHCRDPNTGAIAPSAQEIIRALDSYAEISPSGTGVHVLVRGTLPPGGRKRGAVEMYDTARFFTMTGQHLPGTPRTIEERGAVLARVHSAIFGSPAPPTCPASRSRVPVTVDDQALIARIRLSRGGKRFGRLWRGDVTGYSSHSEADLALAGILAFWTRGDGKRIDCIFRQSGLMRAKWDERHFGDGRTYGQATIEKALSRRPSREYVVQVMS